MFLILTYIFRCATAILLFFGLLSCASPKKPMPDTFAGCNALFRDDIDRKLECWQHVTGYDGKDNKAELSGVKRLLHGAENSGSSNSANEQNMSTPSSSVKMIRGDDALESAKADCSQIYKVGTKNYGKCVMELIR